jgi:hypothetical protein
MLIRVSAALTALALITCLVVPSFVVGEEASVPRCRSSNLKLTFDEVYDGAGGRSRNGVILTNVSNSTCYLFGHPSLKLFDRTGHLLPFKIEHRPFFFNDPKDTQPVQVVMPASGKARVFMENHSCNDETFKPVKAKTLQMFVPGDDKPLVLHDHLPMYCPNNIVVFSVFEPFTVE